MNETNVDLTSLELFATLARILNFRQAALKLSMPVATLSRKISKLEETLDTQLLQRTTRTVVLTEAGSELLTKISGPLAHIRQAARQFDDSGSLMINVMNWQAWCALQPPTHWRKQTSCR